MATRAFQLEDFLPFRLNVLAQEVSTQLSQIYAARFGLDIPQWRIMANLAARGEMTAQAIARIVFTHKSTISRAVTELEGRKLIQRVVDPGDGRAFKLKLTDKGQRMFADLLPLVLEFEKAIEAKMDKADGAALLRGLSALENAVLAERRGS